MGPMGRRLDCLGSKGGGGMRLGCRRFTFLCFFSFRFVQYVRGTHTPKMCTRCKDEGEGFLML
jgi:hypothetical protein